MPIIALSLLAEREGSAFLDFYSDIEGLYMKPHVQGYNDISHLNVTYMCGCSEKDEVPAQDRSPA